VQQEELSVHIIVYDHSSYGEGMMYCFFPLSNKLVPGVIKIFFKKTASHSLVE